jgi:hypothetical protein
LVEFEDRSPVGRFQRTVEIDLIDDAKEPDTDRHPARDRTRDVAKSSAGAG